MGIEIVLKIAGVGILVAAACHGVSIIATVHARSFREMRSIPQLNRLLENGVIERVWILKRQGSAFSLIGETGEKVCGD